MLACSLATLMHLHIFQWKRKRTYIYTITETLWLRRKVDNLLHDEIKVLKRRLYCHFSNQKPGRNHPLKLQNIQEYSGNQFAQLPWFCYPIKGCPIFYFITIFGKLLNRSNIDQSQSSPTGSSPSSYQSFQALSCSI